MNIVNKPVIDLVPYESNSRTHSEEQIIQIVDSIQEFGFTNPILIGEDNKIIAGHGRVMAAKSMGMEEVPTIELSHLSEDQQRAYVIADNKLALNAGWDEELLAIELDSLKESGFDVSLTGFSEEEMSALIATLVDSNGLTDEDAVPEIPEDPVTVLGDIWLMGDHRLMCGDSTDVLCVDKLVTTPADLCFTSPPYAQQRDYKQEISDWDGLMNGVFSVIPVKDGAQILVNLGLVHEKGRVNSYWDSWLQYMDDAEWPLFGWYVWDKGFGMPGNWNGRLAPAHEFIFHFSKGGNKPANKWIEKKDSSIKRKRSKSDKGLRGKDGKVGNLSSPHLSKQPTKIADSVIRVTPQMARNGDNTHPAMFPVALCEYIYKSYAKTGDWLYEPFSGSGTSIIACEKMNMICAAMELAPEYADISVNRWQDYTGKQATLESTGQTFAEVKSERE